ncbi:MAG: reverse transcriptase/maturase family protein, partial [Patescibacteria group bacterium]
MGRIQCVHSYQSIISVENLLLAWREFVRGKKQKKDVQEFSLRLMDNILKLHTELSDKTYTHGTYEAFNISDPKPRNIHKALVRDRLVHHALYRVLYPFFDRIFISDSFSCRKYKGTHRALNRFREFGRKVSYNNTRTCFVLKCDVRKFFASIDQSILIKILQKYIPDTGVLNLLKNIIGSFHSTTVDKGLPLGNLTSQLLVNVYMNEFDQYVKHTLKAKHYIRYADDFVILSHDKKHLEETLHYPPECSRAGIAVFLHERLKLELHPDKVYIKTLASGVDFLGWVHFPDHRVIRTTTRRRMWKRIAETSRKRETVASYLGLLSHGNGRKLQQEIIRTSSSANDKLTLSDQ